VIFFIIGLCLEVVAFFVGYADNVPLIFRVVSPAYARAKQALSTLRGGEELSKEHSGFKEIASLLLKELKSHNPPERIATIDVIRIIPEKPVLMFSTKQVGPKTPIVVELSDGQKPEWDLESLEDRVSQLKSTHLFRVAIGIFLLGVVVQVIGFVVDLKSSS
jgi:hypothetical protein